MWKMTVPDWQKLQYGLLFEPTPIGSVERYAISTGRSSIMAGFLTAEDTTLGNINTTLRVRYIEIPATIGCAPMDQLTPPYYGMFGLNLGMNIKGTLRRDRWFEQLSAGRTAGELQDVNLNDKNSIDQYKFFNRNFLSMGIGTEYSITETTTLTAGLVFQNGFVNVFETAATDGMIQMKQMVLRMGVLF